MHRACRAKLNTASDEDRHGFGGHSGQGKTLQVVIKCTSGGSSTRLHIPVPRREGDHTSGTRAYFGLLHKHADKCAYYSGY